MTPQAFEEIRLIYFSENEKDKSFSVRMMFEYKQKEFSEIFELFDEIDAMQKKYEKENLPDLFPELNLLKRMGEDLREYLKMKDEFLKE